MLVFICGVDNNWYCSGFLCGICWFLIGSNCLIMKIFILKRKMINIKIILNNDVCWFEK